jgi:hypothetical protein
MASSLPSESALDKTVETFGLGAYDLPQSGFEHGEDSNKKHKKKSLPDAGGPQDPFGPDRLLSYPTTPTTASDEGGFNYDLTVSQEEKSSSGDVAESILPGDSGRPAPGRKDTYIKGTQPMSVAQTKLPDGGEVPRTSYYDKMYQYGFSDDRLWAVEDAGVYAGEGSDSLPGSAEDNVLLDNTLGALGNYWSGYTIQDQNVPTGFPTEHFLENTDYQKTNASEIYMKKTATDVKLVPELSSEFLKKFGRKDLVRRHVMAFLTEKGCPQYLASDIIRHVALHQNIFIKDVLDVFPVRSASNVNVDHLASVRAKLIDLEIQNIQDPIVSYEYRHAAAEISLAIAAIQKYED